MPAANPDILGRFWAKVDIGSSDACWQWRSDVDTYGRFRILRGHKAIGGHVFSWILANREDVPTGTLVLHSCDNKRCVNPAHLSLGDFRQNAKEAVARGLLDPSKAYRARRKLTHCKRGHALTTDNLYGPGRCAKCHNLRQRRYRLEAKAA